MSMTYCSECGKEISSEATACPDCGNPQKSSIGILLGIGILLVPIIFSWFTLRPGYRTRSRVIAFCWLFVVILAVFGAEQSENPARPSSSHPAAATSNPSLRDNIPSPAPPTSTRPPSATSNPSLRDNIMNVSAMQIVSEYDNNEIAADSRYKGKYVRISGVVNDIAKDILDNMYVTIGGGADFELRLVQAFFPAKYEGILAELRKGSRITVVCRIDGLMLNAIGSDCVL